MNRLGRPRSAGGLAVVVAFVLAACGSASGGRPEVQPPQDSVPTAAAAGSAFLDPCPRSRMSSAERGDGLPDVRLPCLGAGPEVRLAGLRGEPRLVNVWASWCGPCRSELPWLQAVYADGLDVVGVDAEDRPDSAVGLLDALGVTFPSVSDPTNEFARALGVPSKPTTLFISSDGELVHAQVGPFASEAEVRRLVERYLGVSAS